MHYSGLGVSESLDIRLSSASPNGTTAFTPPVERLAPPVIIPARFTASSKGQLVQEQFDAFLDGSPHAVVGASTDREKYGNKVLRVYQQNNRPVFPINPKADEVEGLSAYPNLKSLPESVHGVSVITPGVVTEAVVEEAIELGIQHIWMQPGAETETAIKRARESGMNVIAGGPCLLVVLGYRESD